MPQAIVAAAAHGRAFAAARLLRELARDAHGNLAAVGAAPLPAAAADDAIAAELQSLADEFAAVAVQLATLRDRAGALAERHLAANADRLKPHFGYAIATGRGVTRATTPT